MKQSTGQAWGRVLLIFLVVAVLLVAIQTTGHADPAIPPPKIPEADENQPYVPPLEPPPPTTDQSTTTPAPTTIITDPILDMKVLVLYDGTIDESGVYNTATAYLDILGLPYTTLNTSLSAPEGTIESSDLWDGLHHGYYNAIFVTTSNVWYGLSSEEQNVLDAYMRDFRVRQVTWYAYPAPTPYGLDFVRVVADGCASTTVALFNASLTPAGATTFHYLKDDLALPIIGYCLYGYTAAPTAGADVTPLLLDDEGDTILAIYRPGDGREHMVFTMGAYYPALPPGYIHARLLPYGIINWATRGIFLGQRHLYFTPQPDDVLSWGDAWNLGTHWYDFDDGYRNTPADLDNLAAWQTNFRTTEPNAAALRIEMPFNGDGAEEDIAYNMVLPGTLTAKAVDLQAQFTWLNHTYSHRDLDINENPYPDYAICSAEINDNTMMAAFLGFSDYTTTALLTGDYSGINPPNPDLANAAYDLGIRFMHVNASEPGYNNPTPNTGLPHPTQPEILLVPRYANNIYYAATTPAQETDLYNIFYCPTYVASGYTQPCFTYEEIMANITDQAFGFLLDFSTNATMFHMNNFGNYGGGQTLMTDFVELLYGKYNTFYNENTPILSPRTQEIGALMRQRMAYNSSAVAGQIACGNEITLHTAQAATIPLTGITFGDNVEAYAGQPISYLAMDANETLLIPGETARIPAAISDLAVAHSGSDVSLSWSATSVDTLGQPLTAVAYRIYARANDPYFTPTPADLLAEVATPSFTHVNGAGNPDENYTYLVTAVGHNCWQRESALSNRVAEFDFVLSETPGTDFNWIALPLDSGLNRASDLKAHVENNSSAGVSVLSVAQWAAVSQNYQSFSSLPFPHGDFDLTIGGAYRLAIDLAAGDTAIWTMVGRVPEPAAFSYALYETNSSDFNWLMLPLQYGAVTAASWLQNEVENNAAPGVTVFAVSMWNTAAQSYQTYTSLPVPGGDFPTRIGYPYRLSLEVETGNVSTWPQ